VSNIEEMLDGVEAGQRQVFKNVCMFPLLRAECKNRNYIMLDEALENGTVEITEISDSGSVPNLRFLNNGDIHVLLLDGEELVGAKQNRVLNLSILAPANASTTIPVSCVEAGRWAYSSQNFSSAQRTMFNRGRAAKSDQVSKFMRNDGSRRSNQGAIWEDISAKSGRMSVASDTAAMSDIFESYEKTLDEFVNGFHAVENQAGAVFSIDGMIMGIDLFDNPDTLGKTLSKLVRSYGLDAIETVTPRETPTSQNMAARFLEHVKKSQFDVFPAVGLGQDLRINSRSISGGVLVNDDQAIHLWAFPLRPENPSRYGRMGNHMARASRRRRMH
jgi:hypothetical protein